MLIQIFITPIVISRCDLIRVYNVCMTLWPWTFFAMPFVNAIARMGLARAQETNGMEISGLEGVDPNVRAMVWCGVAAVLALSRAGCLAYS